MIMEKRRNDRGTGDCEFLVPGVCYKRVKEI